MTGCELITDIGLLGLSVSQAPLQSICITHCPGISDVGVAAISKAFGDTLESMDCSYCTLITHKSLFKLARHCPSLRYVVFTGCVKITDGGIEKLAKNSRRFMCRFTSHMRLIVFIPSAPRTPNRTRSLRVPSSPSNASPIPPGAASYTGRSPTISDPPRPGRLPKASSSGALSKSSPPSSTSQQTKLEKSHSVGKLLLLKNANKSSGRDTSRGSPLILQVPTPRLSRDTTRKIARRSDEDSSLYSSIGE